jgi:MFS family permease
VTRLRRSLRASIVDGAACAAMSGFGELYFPAFGLLLGASAFQVGLLTTVPMLIGASVQLWAPRLAHRAGDKRFVVACAVLQALLFAPIAWLALAGGDGYPPLLLAVALYWSLALGINPVWNAWMGRMVPPVARSRFFGRRGAAINAALLASTLAGGLLLHVAADSVWGAARGFVAVFALAGMSRLVSARFLAVQHDPRHGPPPPRPSLAAVVRGLRGRPYGRLIALLVLMMGAVHLSAAYFPPYMLRELGLSYAEYAVLNAAVLLSRIVSSPYWGEVARRHGNRRALQVSGTLLVPLAGLWVLSDHFLYLIALQVFAGFAWAGFELATVLTLFDATRDDERAGALSLYVLLNGVAIVVGSLLGGTILRGLGSLGYPTIFLLSTALRAAILASLARGVGVRRSGEHRFRTVFVEVISFGRAS